MPESNVIENYLKQVLIFKQNKELHADYLNPEQRDSLLAELSESLGFEPELWKIRKKQAKKAYDRFVLLKEDNKFRDYSPRSAKYYIEEYIYEAISLDPFNEEYLKTYLFDSWGVWKVDQHLKVRYMNLFKPTSTEFQNVQVDLKLGRLEPNYDYLSDDVIKPLVNGLVFLKKELERSKGDIKTQQDKLKEVIKDAGIDHGTIQEIGQEVEQQLKIVQEVNTDWFVDWTKSIKAYLAIEKAVELAPYNHEVVYEGIRFYGGHAWRILLGFSGLKSNPLEEKNFNQMVFGKTKPSSIEKLAEAQRCFEKAKDLESRFLKYPPRKNEEKSSSGIVNIERLMSGRRWRDFEDIQPEHVAAFMDKEEIAFKVLTKLFELRSNNWKSGLIFGIIVSAIICYVGYVVIFPYGGIMLPIFASVMATLGIIGLREYLWKKKIVKINLDE